MSKTFGMIGGGGGGIKLASIAITTPPAKTTYTAGKTFDPAGMVVEATYSNGAKAVATGYTFVPSTALEDGTTAVTIQYTEGGVTKTAEQPIIVLGALNDWTWAQIKEISDAGLASSYFAVGDRKAVTLSGTAGSLSLSGTYYCYIIGIDHNSAIEGTNRIHFQFGYTAASGGVHIAFIDGGYESIHTSGSYFNMNNAASNSGGWANSRMRTTIIPTFKACLPSDLQAVLKTVTKYSDNTGGTSTTASYVTATTDDIFLLSEWEVFGAIRYANSAEQNYQAQYAYYSAGNSKNRYRHSATGATARWWLRSVYEYTSASFCAVDTAGGAYFFNARYSHGFAPAFCV